MGIGNFFRRIGRTLGGGDTSGVSDDLRGSLERDEPAAPSRFSLARWPSGRREAIEKLQVGYERLLGLCETIEQHMQDQHEQGRQVADSLMQLSGSIDQMPALLERLSQRLDRIADQAGRAAAGADRLTEAVDALIPAQRSQNDLLSSVNRQLNESFQTNAQLAEVMVELKGAMQTLARCEQERGRIFDNLATVLHQRDEQFLAMVERHTRTFRWAWLGTLSAAAVALVIAVLSLVM